MLKKFGALGLMLTAGMLFVHPSPGEAQDRYQSGYYYQSDHGRDRDYRSYDRRNFREDRETRKSREREMRERERWERRNYRNQSNGYWNNSRRDYR